MLMKLHVINFPTNQQILDLFGFIPQEIGVEKVLNISKQYNTKGCWLGMSYTRNGNSNVQNANRYCREVI